MNLRGIYPPCATPFTADGSAIDLDAVRFNVDRWMATGLRGLVVLGSNGEAPYVDEQEADQLVAAVRERAPRDRVLIVGTGRESTKATIDASGRAGRLGADFVLVRAPGSFKAQMTSEAFIRHFTAVADASPVPVLLYNFGAAFGVNIGMDVVMKMAEHPNVAGLKESGGDLAMIADQVSQTPDGFVVVVGSAPTLYASLCVGVTGGVVAVANVVPDAVVKMLALFDAGKHAEALALQRAITPLARAVTGGYGVAGLKAAMTIAGYRGGAPRSPLAAATPKMVADLERLIHALNDAL
jgi:4-hydroxy-2-oxoglutarate aldolase